MCSGPKGGQKNGNVNFFFAQGLVLHGSDNNVLVLNVHTGELPGVLGDQRLDAFGQWYAHPDFQAGNLSLIGAVHHRQ